MKHYIDTNNRIWGFDETQTNLIPPNAIEIPSHYTVDQYPCLKLVNNIIVFDEETKKARDWEEIRAKRNDLLAACDWVGLTDVPLSNKQAWLDYRTALRNIPQTYTEPSAVVWPTKPS
jgi:hypothetical protein